MKLNKSIRRAILALLEQNIVVISWGISSINIEDEYISFYVEGFKYKGMVKIIECDGDYKIIFEDTTIRCSIDNIVESLDMYIERTDNYERHIINHL